MKKSIALLVPCFNEEANILPLYKTIKTDLNSLYEKYVISILFVNDGSTDNTLSVIQTLSQNETDVFYINLSRNFGKEIAVFAGLNQCTSFDATILIDADLQNPPATALSLVQKWEEGYDDIYAHRTNRNTDGFIRRILTRIYYKFLKFVSPLLENTGGDFRLMDKRVVESFIECGEYYRYNKGLYNYIGFKKTHVDYTHLNRNAGKTKWSFFKLFGLAFSGIFAFSIKPLRVAIVIGIAISLISFSYIVYIVCQILFTGIKVPGYASLITIMLFFQGIIMIFIGLLGEYVGRVFIETKKRPIYFIRDKKLP